jgi:hypothetical protein
MGCRLGGVEWISVHKAHSLCVASLTRSSERQALMQHVRAQVAPQTLQEIAERQVFENELN